MRRVAASLMLILAGCGQSPSSPQTPAPSAAAAPSKADLQAVYVRENQVLEGLQQELDRFYTSIELHIERRDLAQRTIDAMKELGKAADAQTMTTLRESQAEIDKLAKQETALRDGVKAQESRVADAKAKMNAQ